MFIDKVVEEMKSKPFTMLMILGLYGAVAFLWRAQTSYAGAKDLSEVKTEVAAVKAEVSGVKADINKNSLEQQLRAVRSELFALQRDVDDLVQQRKLVPNVYRARIAALETDRDTLQQRLAAIYATEASKRGDR
jgi:hypothetical protein